MKPPYGTLTAISLDRGEFLWQVPAGETPDNVRNNPALRGLTIPNTGMSVAGVGLMNTKTVVVMGDPQVTTTPEHAAERLADDLHAEREAIHCCRGQWRECFWRVSGFRAAGQRDPSKHAAVTRKWAGLTAGPPHDQFNLNA
jgi:hypothetical protein